MKDISVQELISSSKYIPVDVRAPIEHKDSAIPGSVNVPLFTDDERQEIGTLYKKSGEEAAKWRAMEIVSPKLPGLLGEIKELKKTGAEPVIHCWRGGMRSRSVASFLEYAGIPSYRLEGGYRAYREYILERIPELLPQKAVVLHGMTGTGKTDLLKALQEKGYPVVDLEQMANHRGSIFGMIGMGDAHNQKTFDALLFDRLNEIIGSNYFIIEAESKRIGRAAQPDEMIAKKSDGIHFLVKSSIPKRVERIYDEYVHPFKEEAWFEEEVQEKVTKLLRRISQDAATSLQVALKEKNYQELIEILLIHYYDPRYGHALQEYSGPFHEIDADDPDVLAQLETKIKHALSDSNRGLKI
ncbi:tRNA 2-selenouridine(34) synthase MnmH [Bacillus sp. ISL-35]|uniref:tRNA 2-selenouridine(34) synthase MnmH n=1 Tax=Bacillus sp. ISL-35 TaxID=2819122 RepID=UPI001BE8D619|nr:tRNA 2-selenouridine(34) synthase MnmH [Bacillus sp. ISL-35]MBT2677914.1 tRNA 2-selenouridine(34) synthase MnmH [Bacillus sp. ISL-35]MBT2704947.1 tRNA 2-selenouridine(34) synthase MnmH [Chryseobacterium sp. ISL-80]